MNTGLKRKYSSESPNIHISKIKLSYKMMNPNQAESNKLQKLIRRRKQPEKQRQP